MAQRLVRALLAVSAIFGVMLIARKLVQSLTHVTIDFDVYRQASIALRQGQYLYGADASAHGLPFLYAPIAAIAMVPFGLLPVEVARVIWTVLLLAAVYGMCWLSLRWTASRMLEHFPVSLPLTFVAVALLLQPIRDNFDFGQINLLVGVAVMADLARRTGRLPTGMLTGLVGAVKLTPMIFAVYWFFSGRRRDAMHAFATFFVLGAAGFVLAPRSAWQFWTDVAYDSSRVGVAYFTNESITGVWLREIGEKSLVLSVLLGVVGIAGLVFGVLAARRIDQQHGDVIIAATMLLVSPISWTHHWVWVIPVLTWMLIAPDANWWRRVTGFGALALFAWGPMFRMPHKGPDIAQYSWLESAWANSYFLAGVALVLVLGQKAVRREKAAAPQPEDQRTAALTR